MFRIIALFSMVLLLWVLASNLYYGHEKQEVLENQTNNEKSIVGNEITIRNAGAIKESNTLILVIHGFYDDVVSPSMRATYKVSTNDTMVVSYTNATKGLASAAKELSEFIVQYFPMYKDIVVVGISKGGCMAVEMAKHLQPNKVSIITIDTPYEGTLLATPKAMEEKCKEIPIIGNFFWNTYKKIFRWSTVDNDISIGSEFLRELNYSPLRNFNIINIISTCDWKALYKDLTHFNPEGIGCFFINKILKLEGDGIVPNSSKNNINPYAIQVINISASHASGYKYGLKPALEALEKSKNSK